MTTPHSPAHTGEPTDDTTGLPTPGLSLSDDVLVPDGRIVRIREIRAGDRYALIALHRGLSDRSRYLRFFSLGSANSADFVAALLREVEAGQAVGLVAVHRDRPVALGSLQCIDPHTAEVAFSVADAWHGHGLATLLLERLAVGAERRGIDTLVANVLGENAAMLDVLRMSGFAVEAAADQETVDVRFPVRLTEHLVEVMAARERAADAASLHKLLTPGSVAVIGAGRREHSPGRTVVENLLRAGFPGPVYPVNAAADQILGLRAYPSILDVPAAVDLAVIAVPAARVAAVAEQCARADVRNLVVLSSGFAEAGPTGQRLQDVVMRIARRADMRVVGPNCLGIANTDPAVRLNATFADTPLLPGVVGLMTQSGGVGIAALQRATELGIGLSTFVSAGNKADVSGNDLLMYWDGDDRTRVIAMYLESFGNPSKFSRLARHVSATKPVVVLIGGASTAGRRAATGHTSAAVTSSAAVDALFDQCGVIRVASLEQLLQVTSLLAHQPLPAGRRVVIVGNGGGPCVLAADACAAAGIEVNDLDTRTSRTIAELVPGVAATRNPVDLGAGATADEFARAVEAAGRDPGVDVIVAVHTPVPGLSGGAFADALRSVADSTSGKTIIAVMLGESAQRPIEGSATRIPVFAFPEDAAHVLAPVLDHVRWRSTPRGTPAAGDRAGLARAQGVVASYLARHPGGCRLDAASTQTLLAAYGIQPVPAVACRTADEAVRAAAGAGYPVVIKTADPNVVHKSDVGGVRTGLTDADGVRAAFGALTAGMPEPAALVQHQVAPGLELIVGMTQDDVFGPVVMFGAGGTATDLLADRAVRLAPLTDVDAHALVRSLRCTPLLFGYRGSAELDVAAVEELLLRIGRLADEVPQIAEIDLNPVIASPSGIAIVDAKIRLRPHTPQPATWLPRLRSVPDHAEHPGDGPR